MSGHSPWWKLRATHIIAEAIDHVDFEEGYHPKFNQHGRCIDSNAAQAVIDALDRAGLRIERVAPVPESPEELMGFLLDGTETTDD